MEKDLVWGGLKEGGEECRAEVHPGSWDFWPCLTGTEAYHVITVHVPNPLGDSERLGGEGTG
jgi:hypothetical protein